jgi:hypothetical protein
MKTEVQNKFSLTWHDFSSLYALSGEGSYEHCPPEGDRVMKNTRLTSILGSSLIACALTIGSLASTQSASAQSTKTVAVVDIPFAFQTAMQTLPAGRYRIDRESGQLIRLQGPDAAGGFVEMHGAIKSRVADHGYLVFDRYGDKYFLHQIWTQGSHDGLECSKSRAEKESLQAMNKQAPSTIELAFNSVPQH